ncbi:MAG: hypothetical protein J6B89_03565 [Bacilli bacterium]|nr:hypothetical protein [Bacilli bacterium]
MLEELREDINQYNDALEDFYSLIPEDIEGAYQLAMVFMQIANRWTELQLNSNKYCIELKVTRTAFKDYAYEKYRLASKCHEFCRCIWRQSKEDARNSFYSDM